MINNNEVVKMENTPVGMEESSMEEVAEFMRKKATKFEQDTFLKQILFGMR
ncbi:hypothetical protein HYX10_06200 [Candidatus Woesearchaeota archaeon]|nr:hypothetical protein [Candidatus Woesearchaeota archaeon]